MDKRVVNELLRAIFISNVKYTMWLTNMVFLQKENMKWLNYIG